ncbi:MAG: hypothetical protein SGPRY_012895 [Prymnesium sp.]
MGMGRESRARSYSDDLSLMASLHAPVTGVCIGQHDNEAGRLQVGAEVPGLQYVELPVVGSAHWSVNIGGVGLVRNSDKQEVALAGCEGGCQAIVDSGTSLIALPKAILDSVLAEIGTIAPDCSNVDQLPVLQFTASGHNFTLPPQLYVARMEHEDARRSASLSLGKDMPVFKMPWEHSTVSLNEMSSSSCIPLFMEMNIATNVNGPVMIFGLPFLRRYAARFDRNSQTVGFGQIPLGPGSLLPKAELGLLLKRERPVLKPQHLRLPSWLSRATRHPVTGEHTLAM